jgi:hypothetical protein
MNDVDIDRAAMYRAIADLCTVLIALALQLRPLLDEATRSSAREPDARGPR